MNTNTRKYFVWKFEEDIGGNKVRNEEKRKRRSTLGHTRTTGNVEVEGKRGDHFSEARVRGGKRKSKSIPAVQGCSFLDIVTGVIRSEVQRKENVIRKKLLP